MGLGKIWKKKTRKRVIERGKIEREVAAELKKRRNQRGATGWQHRRKKKERLGTKKKEERRRKNWQEVFEREKERGTEKGAWR